MSVFKGVARDWLPPILVRWLCRMRGVGVRFEGDYATWEEARSRCTGYDAQVILEKVLAATLKVKHGGAAFERDSMLFDEVDYAWPVLAGLMWAAASEGGRLNVLDFGGALGSVYFQHRSLLVTLQDARWNVVEQPHFVEAGQKYIQDERLRFYKTVDECVTENRPNVILLSSVLQYLENPYGLLEEMGNLNAGRIIVDRTPFIKGDKDVLSVQQVPESIFSATLPAWLLSEAAFEDTMDKLGYVLVARMPCEDGYGERFSLKGYLYCRGKS